MPSIYHENCGKPGPNSNDFVPPPEFRSFKSRSAPNSPLIGGRKPLVPRSPRFARGVNQLTEKLAGDKGIKSARFGRSQSFNNKGISGK